MNEILSVADFGAFPGTEDCTAALERAAAACSGRKDLTLMIPPGRYFISPVRGSETWLTISNHDNGQPRRVALHFIDCHGLTVSAHGAELVANGHILPLLIEGGGDVHIEGLTIDWAQPLHAWATMIDGWNGSLDLKMAGGCPWRVIRERLSFLVDGLWEDTWGTYGISLIDNTPAVRSGDNLGSAFTVPWVAEEMGSGIVRLRTHVVTVPPKGDTVILRHGRRIAPAITASGVDGLRMTDITILQAGGMAVIAQRCSDPHLERVKVVAGEGRPLSANHDATHFVSCRGTVRLIDCVFERQLDDATNVHGIYQPIVGALDTDGVVARLVHKQQRGVVPGQVGERLAVVDQRTMLPLAEVRIASVRQINAEFSEIRFDGHRPDCAKEGTVLENLDCKPAVEIRGCSLGHNRARGLLLASGPVLVENNHFYTPGPAIRVHGDARSWYESGSIGNAVIRNNRFERCGYALEPRWGGAVVLIDPEMSEVAGPFHGEIDISDNTFVDCPLPSVSARAVGRLSIHNNSGIGEIKNHDCGEVDAQDSATTVG